MSSFVCLLIGNLEMQGCLPGYQLLTLTSYITLTEIVNRKSPLFICPGYSRIFAAGGESEEEKQSAGKEFSGKQPDNAVEYSRIILFTN